MTSASPVPAVAVRHAVADDLPALASLFDAYRQFYRQPADLPLAARFLSERMARGESTLLVAVPTPHPSAGPTAATGSATPLLGFCQLYPSWCSVEAAPIRVLYDLFVSPDARRAGVGRALLQAAHAQAAAEGARRLDLSTARDNTRAQALYESLGWVRDEVFFTYTLAVTG